MDSIRLKNYRCLEDTGEMEIKPLTFLVGANSSGKSSFLKFFPLLKQSMRVKKRGVFLWTGNNVDLKDFKNTLRSETDQMEISFTLKQMKLTRRMRIISNAVVDDARLTIRISRAQEHYEQLDYFCIKFPDQTIECFFGVDNKIRIKIGSLDSIDFKDKIRVLNTSSLLPHFIFYNTNRFADESYTCKEKIEKLLENFLNDTSNRVSSLFIYSLIAATKEKFKKRIEDRWKKDIDEELLNQLYDLSYYFNINNIIDTINISLLQLAENITYIGPLREATERYYRFQNYAVDEIDPDGSNLAMYLYNLEDQEKKNLNEWITRVFDFQISVVSDGGHVELLVRERGKQEQNLVDIGFGYTQILPILVNIWKTLYIDQGADDDLPSSLENDHILAIEQPELHLHPRFQVKFAILLANVVVEAKKDKKNIRFVIETHSEMVLNKIGELISLNKLDEEDVNVLLFNARQEEMRNYVEFASYSKDGYLLNWPVGFFSEDVD
ncbi:AAA family ATPase [Phocaeicola sartorii]|uniref:AAA family ATPase n=1 Tax=Phocaeicola sartorii TaxID=671267 RepID=UPI00248BF511|nr:AAA family ATPase [Phocaeicola sartorii]